jgi:imidazolonepropionase-like amidohydrolase
MIGQTGTHLQSYFPSGVKMEVGHASAAICDGPDQARRAVREAMREGFDLIKTCTTGGALSPQDSPFYIEWTLEEIKAIVETAASYGRVVMTHSQGAQGIKNAILARVWSVEHGSFQDEEATRMLAETGTYLIPTLSIGRWFLKHGREEGLTAKALEKGMVVCAHHYDAIRRAVKAGVKLAAGTDAIGSMHGGNADELAALVEEIGFSPMQAIVAATRNGAEVCRMADRVGTIDAGKLADLLLVNGDPLNDIRILKDKERLTVFKQGTLVAGGESLQQRQRS